MEWHSACPDPAPSPQSTAQIGRPCLCNPIALGTRTDGVLATFLYVMKRPSNSPTGTASNQGVAGTDQLSQTPTSAARVVCPTCTRATT